MLAELGATAATVVVERPVAGLPAVRAAITGLDVFEKEPGEPTVDLVDALVERMRGRPPDALVAIGGGSALDLAKAARAAYSQDVPFARLLEGDVAVVGAARSGSSRFRPRRAPARRSPAAPSSSTARRVASWASPRRSCAPSTRWSIRC